MEPFISFRAYRNGEWKGHASVKGVRQAIRWANGAGLRIFAHNGKTPGTYVEIEPARWVEFFGEGGAQRG